MKKLFLLLTLIFGNIYPVISQSPLVENAFPNAQIINAVVDTDIIVRFNTTINPESINGISFKVFGRWSGPMFGSINLLDGDSSIQFTPDEPFFYGEWVVVFLSKGIESQSGSSLEYGYSWGFWTETMAGTLNQPEVDVIPVRLEGEGTIQCYGAYAGDINSDGYSDLSVVNEISRDIRLFLNDGNGGYSDFVIYPLPNGNTPSPNEGADFNADGIMDAFVGAFNSQDITIMLGDGNGGFVFSDRVDVSGTPWMITVGDINGDGHVDVVSANSTGNTASVIFGDGMGNMSNEVVYSSPGFPLAIDLGDIDGDGDLDMITSNYSTAKYNLYENDGSGSFLDPVIYNASTAGSCVILHDRDNDGDMDITGIDEVDDLIFIFENDSTLTSIDEVSSVEDLVLGQSFPNPALDKVTINYNLNDSNKASLILYDPNGKSIIEYILDPVNKSITISTSSLAPGVYTYAILLDGEITNHKKMVIIK